MKTTTINNYLGFTYIKLTNVPLIDSKHGPIIDIKPSVLENLVCMEIIKNRFPIRGLEFKLIKSVLKLTNEKLAHELGVSYATVSKWSNNLEERLSPAFEVVVRVFAAEKLGIKLNATLKELRAKDKFKNISISAKFAA